MTVQTFILEGRRRLEQAAVQCADPLLHMKQVVELGLGWDTSQVYLRWEETLQKEQIAKLNIILERRLKGEPFQYIAGYEYFWKSKFEVGPGVLIPRRETELLVEAYLTSAKHLPQRVVELGAGSGNIGISVLLDRPDDEWHAYEMNPQSIPYAKRNRESLLPPKARYFLNEGDFFLKAKSEGAWDFVVANPPYVSSSEYDRLAREIHHEPRMALDGGVSGTEILEKLVGFAKQSLQPGGWLLLEIGADQKTAMETLFQNQGFTNIYIQPDYAALPRIARAQKPEESP